MTPRPASFPGWLAHRERGNNNYGSRKKTGQNVFFNSAQISWREVLNHEFAEPYLPR
jgi:hypothetical protein